jgi:hypothetical protein
MQLIIEAQGKGFGVVENEDGNGWLVTVPSRPRLPAHTQGDFKTSDRAWSAACLIALDYKAVV